MRVVVIGATGNVGSATVRALRADARIDEVVGVARRLPREGEPENSKVSWVAADIATDPLDVVAGADVVVHLAWQIQPSRDEALIRRTNVDGTRRLMEAAIRHRVPAVVYASSVGTYAPGPKSPKVDESWPTTGVITSTYSRQKAAVEAMLDSFEAEAPAMRIVRMRTSLIFQRDAASEIHRLFLGRLLPWHMPRALRLIPRFDSLQFQVTHADDIADAYLRAIVSDAGGPFNIAADPPLDPAAIAAACEGRTVPVPPALVRFAARLSYALHVQPTEAGWVDLATGTPLLDSSRARHELGWSPRATPTDCLRELLDGIGAGAGGLTVPLHPR